MSGRYDGLAPVPMKQTQTPLLLKEMEKPKSAILAELEAEVPGKITKVRTCSDCCMTCNPDGTENTVGRAFQESQTRTVSNVHGTYTWLDCAHCPITVNMTEDEWQQKLREIDDTE